MTITGEDILREAATWIGTPFHHRGLVKGVGVDCGHFIIGVHSAVGLYPKWTPDDYPPDWHLHRGEEMFISYLERNYDRVDEPQPGDVVMFKFGRCASHGAIVVKWPKVVHSYIRTGVVYANAKEGELRGRVHSFWRPKQAAVTE